MTGLLGDSLSVLAHQRLTTIALPIVLDARIHASLLTMTEFLEALNAQILITLHPQ